MRKEGGENYIRTRFTLKKKDITVTIARKLDGPGT